MDKPSYHFMVCKSFRLTGEPQGICHKKDANSLLAHLESEISDRGLNAMISSTSCLKQCEKGPVMVIYPQGWWYADLDPDKLDEILDALERGEAAEGCQLVG